MAQDSGLPVILITGHGDVPMAVDAMRIGAFDFLEKPFNPDKMTELAKKASQQRRMTLDNRALRRELSDGKAVMKKLIGSSPEMERLREDILDLGQADSHVLIDGETGTGKTLVAHALHAVGPRASKKFITLSCSAYAEQQLAEKLFGPDPGDALPLVEEARGGTLCLEDIEALPNAIQARLLTFINEQDTPPQTRIIAICNEHMAGKTLEDSLRPDLFFRLSAMTIICPPLARARRGYPDAVQPHVRDLLRGIRLRRAAGHRPGGRAASAGALARERAPAGEHRRTRGAAEQARIGLDHLAPDGRQRGDGPTISTEGKPLKEYVEAFERMLIDNTMRRHKGSIAAVMDELCLPRRTLNEKMAKYGLSRGDTSRGMRLVWLNAWGGAVWPALGDWIADLHPDVLFLQEVTRAPVPCPEWLVYAQSFTPSRNATRITCCFVTVFGWPVSTCRPIPSCRTIAP
jgi:DNA-binding NtrC family response regulator